MEWPGQVSEERAHCRIGNRRQQTTKRTHMDKRAGNQGDKKMNVDILANAAKHNEFGDD